MGLIANSLGTQAPVSSSLWNTANTAYSGGQKDALGQTPIAGQWVNFQGVNDVEGGESAGKAYFYLSDDGKLYNRKQVTGADGSNSVVPDLSAPVDPYSDPRFAKAGYDPDNPGSSARLDELMSPAGSATWSSDFQGSAPGNLYWNMQDPTLVGYTDANAQTQLAKGDSGLTEFMGKLPYALAAGLVGGGISGALSGGAGALGEAGGSLSLSSLPSNYWSMLADAGGGASDAAGAAAGTFGAGEAAGAGGALDPLTFGTSDAAGFSGGNIAGLAGAPAVAGSGGTSGILGYPGMLPTAGGGAADSSWFGNLGLSPNNLLNAGSNIGSALLGSNAAQGAANTQSAAADRATALQGQIYGQTRQDLAPWLQQGQVSLGQLGAATATPNSLLTKPFGLEDFKASPAYQFNLSEGEKAINKGAAARGKYYAPSTLQDISKYSQGVASNEFNNAYNQYNTNMNNIWNRLYSLSGSGQNAANQTGAFGQNYANQASQNIIGSGNAQAAGQVGSANAVSSGLGSAYNNYLLNDILTRNQQSSY